MLSAFLLLVAASAGHTPPTMAGVPMEQVGTRGAKVPFVEYEAENAANNGRVIGPVRTFGELSSEASGRKAVMLHREGDYVEFTLDRPANALTVRAAIPDSDDGAGLDASLGVYVGGERLGSLATTSRYGWFYGDYPFTNRPAAGKGHHFFDEARLLLNRTLAAGTRVRLMKGKGDAAPWYAVDVADFELVPPPKSSPPKALSIVAFGADPTGARDSGGEIQRALDAARQRSATVWIPAGLFKVNRHLIVDRVTIAGAGPWYSVLQGRGAGIYGRKPPSGSTAVVLRDFALIGEVAERVDADQLAGIGGAIGGGSLIEDIWLQHHKTGVWLDGPLDGVTLRRVRILDNSADGLNLRRGVSHAVVEDSFVRNSGDDGLAMWSQHEADHDNSFRNNTIVAPILANGIAIYGGHDIDVRGNLVADTLAQGGGIHLGNRFKAEPLSGRILVDDNLVVRSGSFDPNWRIGVGAVWLFALDRPIKADIRVSRTDIIDSTLPALHLMGSRIEGLTFRDIRIDQAGSYGGQLQSSGSTTFEDVTAVETRKGGIALCSQDFLIIRHGHVSGLDVQRPAPCP